jgi:acyl dehydratase
VAKQGQNSRRRSQDLIMPPEVGQTARRSLTVTREHVDAFARLTGDYNPLHFDADFAARTRFGGLVVQGGLTTGLLHALVAMDLPGPGSVFLSQQWKFTAPVYIDDTITAEAEVVSVHPSKPVTQLRIRVTRQTGETVLEGEAWCYTMKPDGPVAGPEDRTGDPSLRSG